MPNQYSPNQPGGGNSGAKSVKSDANMQLLKGSGAWVGGTEGLSYFWNAKEQAYFYQTDDKLTRSKSNFYRVTEGSAVYNNLAKKYPRGKNEYGVDYNPILDKYTTISTGKLEKNSYDPVNGSSIRFPFDMLIDEGEDFVMFDFYDYKPPFQDKVSPDGQAINQTLKQYNATGFAAEYFKDKRYPQILLYMPQDIKDAFSAKWQGKKFGALTTGIISAAGADGVTDKILKGAQTTGETITAGKVNAAAAVVTTLATKLTGDTITANDLFGGISGVARNPNVEVLFQSMELRTFDLSFKLTPFNAKDMQSIQAIIKVFKQAMLPQYSIGKDASVFGTPGVDNDALEARFIQVPKVCAVNFMRGSARNEYLPRYKMCAITDVNVDYTPDNVYATIDRGSPVATELKISFMETKLVFSEDIAERGF